MEYLSSRQEEASAALKQYFHKSYNDLDEEWQKKIAKIYPQKISEAEPKNYGGK